MPQLMPLFWVFANFMIFFVFMIFIMIYYNNKYFIFNFVKSEYKMFMINYLW